MEADIFNNKISNDSPLGKALVGHKLNEEVTVESPNGSYKVTIVKIA
jgi:transcription elongation factor GreA